MANKTFGDVAYVHAAAQDCVPSASVPAPYAVGDTVGVELGDGTIVDVELSVADIVYGSFQGVVKDNVTEGIEIGDVVTFRFK